MATDGSNRRVDESNTCRKNTPLSRIQSNKSTNLDEKGRKSKPKMSAIDEIPVRKGEGLYHEQMGCGDLVVPRLEDTGWLS